MSARRFLELILLIQLSSLGVWAGTEKLSVCSLQEQGEKFLYAAVEIDATIFAGNEYPRIRDANCSFRFARGDDYQSFGKRFEAKQDRQWRLMKRILGIPQCASNIRVARARIVGTIIRAPATGTISADAMPLELVIQSVSGVSKVSIDCGSEKATVGSTKQE